MQKSPYRYVCLDCRNAPQISKENRVSLTTEPDRATARRHVFKYNHRVAGINAHGRIVFVYFLDEKNHFRRASLKEAPPF